MSDAGAPSTAAHDGGTGEPGRLSGVEPVTFEGVTFSYRHARPVLEDATWHPVSDAGLIWLRGPSGSGKTTVLGLISGLIVANHGTVRTLGLDMSTARDSERRRLRSGAISHVYQDFRLLPELTAVENVALPLWLRGLTPHAAGPRALEVLREIGLVWAADRRPDQLSGGEQQRVGLARALVTQPRLVLADEPTANLDDESAATVAGLLRNVAHRGVTVIVASHDARFAAGATAAFEITDQRLRQI